MTRVQLCMRKGQGKLLVDGMDLSDSVTGDWRIESPTDLGHPSLVRVTLIADQLDVDMDDAIVTAVDQ